MIDLKWKPFVKQVIQKTQIQYDVTIESCTVHKISEKKYFIFNVKYKLNIKYTYSIILLYPVL